MRNLSVQKEIRRRISTQNRSDTAVGICQIFTHSSAKVVLSQDGHLICVGDDDGQVTWSVNLNDVCDENDEQSHRWFDVTYVDPDIVCLSSSGAIVSVSQETGACELVGEFENGIQAGMWSPDREVLVLVTFTDTDEEEDESRKKSVVLTMNAEFEVLAETDVEDHLSSHSVSICWKPDSSLCAISSVDVSDEMRKIRWYKRETLELHAIGRSEDGSGKLVPNLQSTPIAWAGPGCSQLVASVIRKGKKTQQIAFFEPNGLRHREFNLRDDPEESTVLWIDWNVESDLLALAIRQKDFDCVQIWHRSNYHWYLKQETRFKEKVVRLKFHPEQAYVLFVLFASTTSEIHWREYELKWESSTVLTQSPLSLAFSVDGCLLHTTPLDKALVPPPMYAATTELSAPVSQVVLPRKKSSDIVCVTVLSNGQFTVLGKGNKPCSMIPGYMEPSILASVELASPDELDVSLLRNFVILEESTEGVRMLAVKGQTDREGAEDVVELMIPCKDGCFENVQIVATSHLEGRALSITGWADTEDGVLVQLENGELFEYGCDGALAPSPAEPLLEPCPWIAGLTDMSNFDDGNHSHRQRLVIGLSARGRLYCHDLMLCDSATSFFLSNDHEFLCYASFGSQCQLRFLSMIDLHNFDPLMGSEANVLLHGYEPRDVERGSRLVAVLPEKPMAILQLPRGNMEGVFPRALVLRYAIRRILTGDFKVAFDIMRRQKVDLNLIIDLDPLSFLGTENAKRFLRQVSSVDHLNLFISCLQNTDCTKTRFMIPGRWRDENSSHSPQSFNFTSKVNATCQLLRTSMIEAGEKGEVPEGHFLLPILSTYAKEDPPKLEDALSLIKKNALSRHPATSKKPPLFSDSAQSSIHYLAFLAEYELLFETALGMYDYDLARAVARNSQMDPKIYLPLLTRYRTLPMYYARYEVDVKLKRFESALRNLCLSGENGESIDGFSDTDCTRSDVAKGNSFENCLAFLKEHRLYGLGLELFQNEDQQTEILRELGDHFLGENQASNALSIFLAMKPIDMSRAKSAARQAKQWRTLFSLCETDSLDSKVSLAHDLAESLVSEANVSEKRREILADAARLLLDYGNDIDAAVDILLQGEYWEEAQRVCHQSGRSELERKCVESAASFSQRVLYDLSERGDTFEKSNIRYAEVVVIRRSAVAELGDEGAQALALDETGSLFSVASNASQLSMVSNSSTLSTSTISSVISVKSTTSFSISGADEVNRHKSKFNQLGDRQKKKKKKGKGRSKALPGSEKELQALVDTLRSSCVDEAYRDVIAATILFLFRNRHAYLARTLYDEYKAFVDRISKSQAERLEKMRQDKLQALKREQQEGNLSHSDATLPVEKEVDALACKPLPQALDTLFSNLPKSFE